MKNKRRNNLIFILLILIVLPFRLYHLNYPLLDAFNFRQAQTATITLNFFKNGINLFQTELDIFGIGRERFLTLEFPLYEAIVSVFYKIFFVSDMWGRLISISFGVISAVYLYRITKLITKNKKWAFFSSFFFLFAPLNLFYQRTFMIEPTIIALLLGSVYYFLHWTDYRDRKSYLLAILLLTLGFIHKGLYGPFWLLPLIIYYIRKKSILSVFSLQFMVLTLFPLFSLFLWQKHVNLVNTVSNHAFFTTSNVGHLEWNFGFLQDRLSIADWQFRLKQIIDGIFLKPGLALFLIGLISVIRSEKSGFLLSWLLSQFIYFILLFRIQQQNYYQIIMVPTFSIFISAGLISLEKTFMTVIQKIARKEKVSLLVSSLFLSTVGYAFIIKSWINIQPSYYIDWNYYNRWRLVGKILPSYYPVIFATAGNDWNSVYTYVSGRKMMTVPVEQVSEGKLKEWRKLGYAYLILHEYDKYPSYFAKMKMQLPLGFLNQYQKILSTPEFDVYLL